MAKNDSLGKVVRDDAKFIKIEMNKLPRQIANEAVNEFTENFRRQGFRDSTTKKWKPRKENVDPGRGILIGSNKTKRTGSGRKLWRSIKRKKVTRRRIVVGSDVPYAGVHNYGLMSGRGSGFRMPQRRFMGQSKTLKKNISKLITKAINKGFDR